ncbi:hypothetical protein FNX48_001145, partial [Streptomyces sp. IF17]|nr:hypothetical protein [Streptomyces alkaliphilus]
GSGDGGGGAGGPQQKGAGGAGGESGGEDRVDAVCAHGGSPGWPRCAAGSVRAWRSEVRDAPGARNGSSATVGPRHPATRPGDGSDAPPPRGRRTTSRTPFSLEPSNTFRNRSVSLRGRTGDPDRRSVPLVPRTRPPCPRRPRLV